MELEGKAKQGKAGDGKGREGKEREGCKNFEAQKEKSEIHILI